MNITGGRDLTLHEVNEAASVGGAGGRRGGERHLRGGDRPELDGEIVITVVATRLGQVALPHPAGRPPRSRTATSGRRPAAPAHVAPGRRRRARAPWSRRAANGDRSRCPRSCAGRWTEPPRPARGRPGGRHDAAGLAVPLWSGHNRHYLDGIAHFDRGEFERAVAVLRAGAGRGALTPNDPDQQPGADPRRRARASARPRVPARWRSPARGAVLPRRWPRIPTYPDLRFQLARLCERCGPRGGGARAARAGAARSPALRRRPAAAGRLSGPAPRP